MASVTWDMRDFIDGLGRAEQKVTDAVQQGTRNVAEDVLRRSQALVPHDTGTLQNSGHVEHFPNESIIGYGGMANSYAIRLHEHPEFNFQKGRQGKYLEQPLLQNISLYKEIYGDTIGFAL